MGSSKKLFHCAGCKTVMYCSRECQKGDWKEHKEICAIKKRENARWAAVEATPGGSGLPDGITMFELEARYQKWEWAHRSLVQGVITHGLDLITDPLNATRKILHIIMRPVDRSVHQDSARRYFEFVDAVVIDCQDALHFRDPWPHIVENLHQKQALSLRAGQGLCAALVITAEPMAERTLMAAGLSKQNLIGAGFKRPDPTWRTWLKHCMNTGDKYPGGLNGCLRHSPNGRLNAMTRLIRGLRPVSIGKKRRDKRNGLHSASLRGR
ncbi:hypothetical protein EIP91_007869 [Steccherinum ochraceum]|uniref:MYND-type domain-containing protein n=1 Tax=Steccherinum ochraceum TaxID=92696 RepID=A0A4R0RHM0_9APHY|nr:hypothetical protein EIP91_007869 [Steccherinum ochraceum]